MLTELIQGAIKKQFTKEQREIIDRTQDNMQLAGVPYIGTCIPFKEERGFETHRWGTYRNQRDFFGHL